MDVYDEIREEQARGDQKHGGPEHDDKTNAEVDWLDLIHGKVLAVPGRFRSRGELRGQCPMPWASDYAEQTASLADRPAHLIKSAQDQYRRRLVQIAALAVAAIESFDRRRQRS